MTRAVVLADDATGALEIGALLAEEGIATTVTLNPERTIYGAEAVVIDTETRHLSPDHARRTVADTARRHPAAYLFKKTDSTLRGNIAAEFQGLLDACPDRTIQYAPAYPALGRTLANGVLLIDGVPVAQTEFGRDALNPVRESHIPTLLGETPASLHDHFATVPVTETSIAAGTGGLARDWVKRLPLCRGPKPALPRIATLYVLCGSRHPMSLRQAEFARQLAGVSVAPDHRPLWPSTPAEALLVFGGDTAYALLTAAGVTELTPLGEALPGVPVSRIHYAGRRLTLLTKAGGFGGENLVATIRERLKP